MSINYQVNLSNDYSLMTKKGWVKVNKLKTADQVVGGKNVHSTLLGDTTPVLGLWGRQTQYDYQYATNSNGEYLLAFKNWDDPNSVTNPIHVIPPDSIITLGKPSAIDKLLNFISDNVEDSFMIHRHLCDLRNTIDNHELDLLPSPKTVDMLECDNLFTARLTISTTRIIVSNQFILTKFMNTIAVLDTMGLMPLEYNSDPLTKNTQMESHT